MKLCIHRKQNGQSKNLNHYTDKKYCQFTIVDDKDKIQYYKEINFPILNGNVYYGVVVGINMRLKSIFVKFGHNHIGMLSFFSIPPSYFGDQAETIINSIKQKKPHNIRDSLTYKQIDYGKYLHVGLLILVQVIHVYHNKKIKLSGFIALECGHVKYIPNSIDASIKCKDPIFKKFLSVIDGYVVMKKCTHDSIRVLDKLRDSYNRIKCMKYYGQVMQSDLISYLLSKFFITEIVTTDKSDTKNIEYTYGFNTTYVNKNILIKKYHKKIKQLKSNKIVLANSVSCLIEYTSTGTQISLNALSVSNPVNRHYINELLDQMYIRNMGGLIIIIIHRQLQPNGLHIKHKFSEKFYKHRLRFYMLDLQGQLIIILSKKHRLHLIRSHRSKKKNSGTETSAYMKDGSQLLIEQTSGGLHIDVNRNRSKNKHYIINEIVMSYVIEYIKSNQIASFIFIDLLEDTMPSLNTLRSFTKMKLPNAEIHIFSLSVMMINPNL